MNVIKTIDLFSGIGGIRLGFERACTSAGVMHECVFASDINKNACKVYRNRFGDHPDPLCDIRSVLSKDIPDFDVLLGGFPCQAFSLAGTKRGFNDTRGTLFFDVARIIRDKKPSAFLLENVRGLLSHDKKKTFKIILGVLDELGYCVTHSVLNSQNFGVPQNRPRVYIVGFLNEKVDGDFKFPIGSDSSKRLFDILEPDPVDEREYLSKSYWETLLRHRKRHEEKGQGFGYEIKTPYDIANTIMCGGMGKERNLLVDASLRPLPDWANTARIRVMTPIEWERIQGFPDNWTEAAPHSARMDLLGNSVTVNVIEAISAQMLKGFLHPTRVFNSVFGQKGEND